MAKVQSISGSLNIGQEKPVKMILLENNQKYQKWPSEAVAEALVIQLG